MSKYELQTLTVFIFPFTYLYPFTAGLVISAECKYFTENLMQYLVAFVCMRTNATRTLTEEEHKLIFISYICHNNNNVML